MKANLRRAAGSLLVAGLSGPELTPLERAWLGLVRPAGVILFRRNIVAPAQTRHLLDEATALCTPHAARLVDVEGGTVNRLRDALAPIPSAQAVAAAAPRAGSPDLAEQHGELIGRAVRAFGFNTTLAPVLDLALPASAQVLGTRAPAPTAAGVVAYARGLLAGLEREGIAGCGKHFPGLAGASLDTHFETPQICRSWQELSSEDLEPYRTLADRMPIVMTNHAAYPETPGRETPASASPFWISTVLRRRIGYQGIILSDDLEMGGILRYMSVERAAVEAVRAGSDLIEICHSAELILRSYEALLAEAERSPGFARLLVARSRDVERRRRRLYAGPVAPPLAPAGLEVLRQQILDFGERVRENTPETHPVAPEARPAAPAEAS